MRPANRHRQAESERNGLQAAIHQASNLLRHGNLAIGHYNWDSYRVAPGQKVRLARIAADAADFCEDKKHARDLLKEYRRQINDLAAALAAENKSTLLVVLQGMDASGKDGAVKKVFTGVNPQHCRVTSFKEPDREELEHDYLWRVYRALPATGQLGVFNRSHYEDVIARQARGDIPRKEGLMRLRQMADVERAWAENGMVIRKFFLHISRSEQTDRFRKRLENRQKHWKVEKSDFRDRKLWPTFQKAYEEVLRRTSTPEAPWYIIPADHKWYRDVAVAGVVLAALRAMRPQVPTPKLDRSKFKL
jgi:PPK2 family polyphosphate:nucleotide phosphotransferase